MRNKITAWKTVICIAVCAALTACGSGNTAQEVKETETTVSRQSEIVIDTHREDGPENTPQGGSGNVSQNGSDNGLEGGTGAGGGRLIQDQTFEVELAPLGKVTFASYEPDVSQEPLTDVTFQLQKDGRTILTLEGMYEDNIRANESFLQVEAVSFPDYNNDGYNDIIIICNYAPVSGPEVGTGYSEARIYSGNAQGSFTLERGVTDAANSAVAEKTVKSILGFMGVGRKDNQAGEQAEATGWKKAYIDHLNRQDDEQWQGYHLIYVDSDDIPELVEIGRDEATGCGIVSFADGSVDETFLRRLYFTYIERGGLLCNSEGNMDYYYDLVFRMENGRLNMIASGYYGAEDNSKVEIDANGDPVYVYEWDGVRMEKDAYDQALNAVYPMDQAREGYEWGMWMSREEVIQAIKAL